MSRLRFAILLPALAAAIVVIPVLWLLFSDLLQRSVEDNLESSVPVLGRLVEPHLSEPPQDLQSRFVELAGGEPWRLTLVTAEGVVVADSDRTGEQLLEMDNHADRPEIREAMKQERGVLVRWSSTLQEDFVYAAQMIRDDRGEVYVMRLSQPIAELGLLRERLAWLLVLAAASALVVMTVVSWWLYRALFHPLAILAADASRMGRGDLGRRVTVPEAGELADLGRSLNRLAEGAEGKIATAEAHHSHMKVIVGSMTEGILVTDSRGRSELANAAFRRLFRVGGTIGGRTCYELTGSSTLDARVARVLREGGDEETELELAGPGNRSVAVSISALSDRSGAVVAARDITDLERLGEVRRDLVANVSHELKTPLAAIRGYAETLKYGAAEDPMASDRFLHKILQQCSRLQALLDDLLTLSSLEREGGIVEKAAVELRPIVDEAIETLGRVASERDVTVRSELNDVPRFDGNGNALEKLALNLLDNAIKYNRPGGSVDVRLESDDSEIWLSVEDTGQGIPEDSLPRLFERFYRVDRGRSRAEGGTGLGLAIVKHAVRIHNGSVEVSSRLGAGTTLTVHLPMEPAGEGTA